MYTNIPTARCLSIIARYFFDHPVRSSSIPHEALVSALRIVMKLNYFKFGDTIWHQQNGAAMGAPPSPPWATMYFAGHEDACCDAFSHRVIFYKRFIDDVFGIWLGPADNEWLDFKSRINNFELEWTFSDLSTKIDFMDLTLSIVNGRIRSTLYEKPLNHHLYIPPNSAHPPGVLLGLIHGFVHRTYSLCSDPTAAQARVITSYHHLRRRGYQAAVIKPIFKQAIHRYLNASPASAGSQCIDSTKILLRVEYHPQDPSSSDLQRLWRRHMDPPDALPRLADFRSGRTHQPIQLNRMIVCYKRPLNLGNLLFCRDLSSKDGTQVSSFLEND